MVTHCRSNFILLISNLPSVRSSRYKANVGNRVIRFLFSLSPSLSLSFPAFVSAFFRSSVTLCSSFFVKHEHCRRRRRRRFRWGFSHLLYCIYVCMYSHLDDGYGDDEYTSIVIISFLSLLHIEMFRFDSFFVHPQVKIEREERKRKTEGSHLYHNDNQYGLFFG